MRIQVKRIQVTKKRAPRGPLSIISIAMCRLYRPSDGRCHLLLELIVTFDANIFEKRFPGGAHHYILNRVVA